MNLFINTYITLAFCLSLNSCSENNSKSGKNLYTERNDTSEKIVSVNLINENDTLFKVDSVITNFRNILPDNFIYSYYRYYLVISNLSKEKTEQIVKNSIKNATVSFYNKYFEKTPEDLIIIFLFKNDESYRFWVEKIYNDTDLSPFGYYKSSKRTMLMNISTGTGTLIHELTHALVRYDFPDIPSWFNEGLGSLYERCTISNGDIKGYVNWRLPTLQKAIIDNNYTSLQRMFKTNEEEFYGERSGFYYSQARYFCLYLQEKNVLKNFYRMFRDNFNEDNTGKIFVEKILNDNIKNINMEFVKWVQTLVYND